MDGYPLEVIVLKSCPALGAEHRWGAVFEEEDTRGEALEDLPGAVSVAVDLVEAPGISSNLN